MKAVENDTGFTDIVVDRINNKISKLIFIKTMPKIESPIMPFAPATVPPQDITTLNEIMPQIRKQAVTLSGIGDIHGIGHVERVVTRCKALSPPSACMQIIEAAAWLHDVGRSLPHPKGHAEASGVWAREYLSKTALSKNTIDVICAAIREHSYSASQRPTSLESAVLSDADKLDAIGAVGIFRACAFSATSAGGLSTVVSHAHSKLLRLSRKMWLPQSRRTAGLLNERVKMFCAWAASETDLI